MKRQSGVLPELNWKRKLNSRGTVSESDVSIHITTPTKGRGEGYKRISIIIRNKLWTQLDGDYLTFAAMKNRLYFKGVKSRKEGFHISVKNSKFNVYVAAQLCPEEIPVYSRFEGDFSWKYDEFYELYYIELEQEENNESDK